MRTTFLCGLLILLISSVRIEGQSFRINQNGRFIEHSDGKPFFYLGDTAWELFHRLSMEEAALYLNDRAKKGFTVIQAVVLAELDGLNIPNANGDIPLINNDPAKPNEAYFKYVDNIVQMANKLGIVMGLLPTWGDKFNIKWGVGPEIFTPENAEIYGEYLGKRYRENSVIWILGGDRNPEDVEDIAIIDAMAEGIEKGSGSSQLITYHPQGGSNSSEWFNDREWLDFNMFQSGHSNLDDPASYRFNKGNRTLIPVKPTLNGEPCYEDHPVNWLREGEYRWFNDSDARKAAYWGIFSGACGHTYGNHNIWQMWQPDLDPISWARTDWRIALNHPGSWQMKYLREFFESIEWQKFTPDQSILLNENHENEKYQMAMTSGDSSLIIAYTPYGEEINLNLSSVKNKMWEAYWFNPRDGNISLHKSNEGKSNKFKPLSHGRGSDWVLLIKCKP